MGKSHQRGWVVLRGKKWYGYHRRTVLDPTNNEERVETLTVILGQKSQMTIFRQGNGSNLKSRNRTARIREAAS
jgi:hypothetical protein